MKIKRSLLALSALLSSSLAVHSPVEAAPSTIKIVGLNGPITADVAPYVVNGTTLVPLNVIGKLGLSRLTTQWDNKQKIATILYGTDKITLRVNEEFGWKGTEKIQLTVPSLIKQGRVMVPLRFIGESVGVQVSWSAAANTITIGTVTQTANQELTTDRTKALKLPRVDLDIDALEYGGSLMTQIFYFPVGKADRFLVSEGDVIFYYKIQDGKAIMIWGANLSAENDHYKGLPFISKKIAKEIGERPQFNGAFAYFSVDRIDNTTSGIIDATGKLDNVHHGDSSKGLIVDIPEENKYRWIGAASKSVLDDRFRCNAGKWLCIAI
ncbi:copper amine oxidase N-terminal domain-containing protein [Paenibacillus rhizovicinus]|uniref:Copper amine oxidase N-terminal domain-containing protein n=1 Tax=Paenibacillus rhizovicinus TaxID=2704463 RepID=A0A6C0NYM5_9BACL|nr:copper amine oxidase N-terminal domain-containing protein [Paenibacillus rhizovicinus]QHW31299.1 copper amine oxidase N-terminal domain-containing protein [Paenibacillus rhizovicinus]